MELALGPRAFHTRFLEHMVRILDVQQVKFLGPCFPDREEDAGYYNRGALVKPKSRTLLGQATIIRRMNPVILRRSS